MAAQCAANNNWTDCIPPPLQPLEGLELEPGIWGSLKRFNHLIFTELSDPRTYNWPFIATPWPGLAILAAYLYFCNSLGPRIMRDRKPFQLKNTLIVYNFFQVCASVWLFWEALDGAWLYHYNWKCQGIDWTTSPHAMRVARGVYIYFILKLTELLDTVFFVLRKKERQISFLHLYHHTVMPMISWGTTKYFPGGHGTFIGFINTGVHIIMYAYYLLSAFGPRFEKYLWWKKYITRMQMGQFCLAFLHSLQLVWNECGYPRWSVFLTLPNAIFFYYLFNDFYQQAYKEKQHQKSLADKKAAQQEAVKNGKLRKKSD